MLLALFLFSFGLLSTILEIHLASFHLDHIFIALTFVLQSFTYLTSCLIFGKYFSNYDHRTCMIIGLILMGLSYLMLGPCSIIFPRELLVVIFSIIALSIGQALMYRKL